MCLSAKNKILIYSIIQYKMPKLPIDYSNTIIYKLVKNDDYENANIYIGSTTDFIRRKNNHKNCCNNEKQKGHNDKKYQYIRENGGWGEWNMIEVEKHNCNDSNEARAREEYWRCHFNSQLNSIRAYRTEEERKQIDKERKREYREHNEYREYQKQYQKQYYEQNRVRLIDNMKIYYNNKKNTTDSLSDSSAECI